MELNQILTNAEKNFNIAGSIPLVGCISGAFRSVLGKIQGVVGLLFAGLCLIGQMVDRGSAGKWERLASIGLEHALHGSFNALRGWVESLFALLLIGSVGLLIAQTVSPNGFNPIFKYGQGFHPPLSPKTPTDQMKSA